MDDIKCLRCKGKMIQGTTMDRSNMGEHGQYWKKDVSFLSWPADPIQTVTYACTKCGYLESYLEEIPK